MFLKKKTNSVDGRKHNFSKYNRTYYSIEFLWEKKGLINWFDSALFDCLHKLLLQRLNVKILYAKDTPQNKKYSAYTSVQSNDILFKIRFWKKC